jgi:HD-like signal output (HDOD) protein
MARNDNDNILKTLLTGAALPALPQSAIRVLELVRDPECSPATLATPIESDPGLVSQVLRFVNSSYFGFAREISSIRTAISLVGTHTIKNFVLWSAVFSSIPDPKSGVFHFRLAWHDSLKRAVFARSMAKILHIAASEDAFCAALLQDVAVPMLVKAKPEEYCELLQIRRDSGRRLSDLERERFGWTHGDAAGILCGHWNLPESLCELIARHLELERINIPGAKADSLTTVILSSLLQSASDAQWSEKPLFEEAYARWAPPAAPSPQDFLEGVDRELKELVPMTPFASDPPPSDRRKQDSPSRVSKATCI